MTETLAHGYLSESSQQKLSDEYQHDNECFLLNVLSKVWNPIHSLSYRIPNIDGLTFQLKSDFDFMMRLLLRENDSKKEVIVFHRFEGITSKEDEIPRNK